MLPYVTIGFYQELVVCIESEKYNYRWPPDPVLNSICFICYVELSPGYHSERTILILYQIPH